MAQPQAFVDWVNTFEKFSSSVSSINDLSDGTVMIDIVCDIDPKWFKLQRLDAREENWVIKFNRLKRMYMLLTRYYEEVLGLSTNNLEKINLTSLVRDGDVNETTKLCSLVVTMAVRHPNNAVYIEKIQTMSPKSQEGLMVAIESIMKRLGDPAVPTPDKQASYNPEDEMKLMNSEFNKALAEKEALQKAHQALMEEHTTLRDQSEAEELKQKLKDMEIAIPQSSQGGKMEFLLKTEADQLRHELARSEKKRHEVELALESSSSVITDLTRKVEASKGYADEAAKLKDQLDEYRHAADKLKKTENVIEKYKKKLEDGTLEQENRNLLERNQAIEDKYQKVANFKTLMENYKQQILDLQTERTELLSEKNKYEYEYKHWRTEAEASKLDKSRDLETIQLLADRIKELELGDGEPLKLEEDEEKNDSYDIDQSINDSELSDALKGTTMTKLKLKILELERELTRLREGKSADSNVESNLIVLQNVLEDTKRMKEKYEKEYIKAQKEKNVLESELARYKSGASSNGLGSSVINSDSSELMDTKRKLIEAEIKLSKFEEAELKHSKFEKENETKSDPNLEIRMNELEAENGDLKRQNEKLMDFLKNLETNNYGEDTKNQIAEFHKQIADSNKKFDNSKRILAEYYSILDKLKRENEAYKVKIIEMEKQFAEEFTLMTSAWYNIGRRIQGDHVSIQRRKPTSFLGQQRMLHDNQIHFM
ncbi:13079_t:CDS:10 [Entrophospora sp. SA101]|nr:13079_t:CDS:10 [Entrophospora sp. SA101]